MGSGPLFKGQRLWIIGASVGIGSALAHELAGRGADLILSARTPQALSELATDINGKTGRDAEVLPLDIGDRASIAAAAGRLDKTKPLDAVINVAALYEPSYVMDLDPEKADALIRVNLLGTLHVVQLTVPLLRKGGQLVLFGSVAGYFGLPKGQIYSATKAAVINLAESLQVELAPDVRVRLVSPGFVRTRLTDLNDFEMPAIIEADEAARLVADGLAGNSFEIHFPKRFTRTMKGLRSLPYSLALRLSAKMAG
ncbi:MAG: SDR family NAD(P)-dependent oxidoreductase [Pseudomonadota bacterium]